MAALSPVALQAALFQSLGNRTAAGRAAVSAIAGGAGRLDGVTRAEAPTSTTAPSLGGAMAPVGPPAQGIAGVIADAARKAGFTGDALRMAIAVAMAESHGNPNASHRNNDAHHTLDRGPWEINDYWHPEVSDAQAYDPYAAARAAFRISGGGRNWTPWSTYNSGAVRQYL